MPRRSLGRYLQTVRLHQISNHKLFLVLSLQVRYENFKRRKVLCEFHLIGKDIGFMFIAQIIIDHAPYRSFARAGSKCNNFNGMLPVKNIIDPVSSADLYGIDLKQIEVFCRFLNTRLRQIPLIILVRNQVFDWNFLEMNIRHKRRIIIHVIYPPLPTAYPLSYFAAHAKPVPSHL